MAALRLVGLRPKGLEPVDLEVAAGELIFLSGPSGSGKSLLLRAIADLDPHAGEVLIDGVPRAAISTPEWRRRVGLLPAESHWWGDRVGDHFRNPGAGTGENNPEIIGILNRLDFGTEVLGWSVSRLSTGERQRLALARLIANRPEALLLDEATANLDPLNRDRVEAMVRDYRRDRAAAVLWVSHDPEQRRRLAGRGLVIRNARLEPEPWI
ncbi:ABC transporter ATP-binding protein [Candidatus Thiosymbion oneisti]|uniref:ABC transporter ATP-binding protein n=1 Tax=Candidatus Thiosymbion oneisti TaxID=589554 RepID=UPI001062147D|nr:ATP-binding cassette domain-containing protein [Candidatus Thiosymbion oneisti]